MRSKLQGFTLIEISIVLVIIGLLAGGILKGQQMIENAKYKAWVKEIDAYKVAIYTFKDRYGYLPGDFPRAAVKLPVVSGVTAVSGNGNGIIDHAAYGESWQSYMQVLLAGLIPGDPANVPMSDFVSGGWVSIPTPVGGYMSGFSTVSAADGMLKNRIMFGNISAEYARRYDEEFDDGIANKGRVVCWAGFGHCPGNAWPDNSSVTDVMVDF